jgi:hypothetical protein
VSGQYSDELSDFQYISQTDVLTYVSGTQFSVVTDKTTIYQVGRRIKAVVTAGTIYGTITASSSGGTPVITTVTCLWDSGALDSGLSAVSLGVITPTNESLPIHVPSEKAANYSMTVTDIGKIIQANSANAISITLLAANAVPAGATVNFQNGGAGLMTLDGTINSQANQVFSQHEGIDIYSDGAAWRAHRLQKTSSEKTANYSIAITDIDEIIQANSANAISITLLAANAVSAGATLNVQNVGAGLMTLVGTVNAQANRTFLQHEGADIYSDGAAWRAHRLQDELVGAFKWWNKSLTGVPQTLPWGWVECSGQTISDADSPLDGQVIPDINGEGRFVRGSNTSGNEQAYLNANHHHSCQISQYANAATVDVHIANYVGHFAREVGVANRTYANGAGFCDTSTGNATQTDLNVRSNEIAGALEATVGYDGGAEARPVNISMVAIMKIK